MPVIQNSTQDVLNLLKDKALGGKLETLLENWDSTTTIDNLKTGISTEVSARQTADTTLQTNITTETAQRQSADSTLQSNINTVSSRVSAIEAQESTWNNKMNTTNPAGSGSFSMNRSSSSTVGANSTTLGEGNEASGSASLAEGLLTYAIGIASHSEGGSTSADGNWSHAEGAFTAAVGTSSHAEGNQTLALASSAHAEGYMTKAGGNSSHAEGNYTEAKGSGSHAEGNNTIASESEQHVQGRYNAVTGSGTAQDPYDAGDYAFIIGNGTPQQRSNAHTVDWNGNAWYAGDVAGKVNNETVSLSSLKANVINLNTNKVDKVNGKQLSTNDYDNTAKGKVDAIPPNPKYTDTIYDDTAIKRDINNINWKIPGTASAANQLTDKAFVNSSIATNTAHYISYNGNPFPSVETLKNYTGTVTNNDYAFVVGMDSAGNTYYDRYKATVPKPAAASSIWSMEYRLNNSSFTSAQWAAINSGITSGKIDQIDNDILTKENLSNKTQTVVDTLISYPSGSAVTAALTTKENISNKVTTLTSSSTHTQYPSAKLLYDLLLTKMDVIDGNENDINTYKYTGTPKLYRIKNTELLSEDAYFLLVSGYNNALLSVHISQQYRFKDGKVEYRSGSYNDFVWTWDNWGQVGLPAGTTAGQALIYNGTSWQLQDGYGYESDSRKDYTWNGDTSGKTTVESDYGTFCKISEDVDDIEASTLWGNNCYYYNAGIITYDTLNEFNTVNLVDYIIITLSANMYAYIVTADSAFVNPIDKTLTKGIWFNKKNDEYNDYVQKITNGSVELEKQIDAKFIPIDGTTIIVDDYNNLKATVDISGKEDKSNKKQTVTNSSTDYPSGAAVTTALAGKVDKETGKGLSTNDYNNTDKGKVDNLPSNTATALAGKVDKETGKGLSTNDYTTAEKSKVTNLPDNTNSALAGKLDYILGTEANIDDYITLDENKIYYISDADIPYYLICSYGDEGLSQSQHYQIKILPTGIYKRQKSYNAEVWGSWTPVHIKGAKLGGVSGTAATVDGDGNIVVPYCGDGTYGLTKPSTYYGTTQSGGVIRIYKAENIDIDGKESSFRPIVPSNLDYAIKAGLTSNSQITTDADKASCRATIGAIGSTDSSLSSPLPVIADTLNGVTNPQVGQMAIVKTIDESGNITEWENVKAVQYIPITVTCVTQDGVTVTGQTVTIRNGLTAESPIYATAEYNGQPVTFDVVPGFTYFISVSNTLPLHFSPTTASGIATSGASVILTYSDASNIRTYQALADAIEVLIDPSVLIGNVIIDDIWTADNGITVYNDPMIVVDIKNVEDENGVTHLAAICERKYATINSVQFDQSENERASELTATEGLYYIGKSGTTYTKLNLNAGDTVPYQDYEEIYHNEINFNGDMVKYGYNRWSHSAIRQWLNSSADAGSWWSAKHIGDIAPTNANTIRGYKAGCSAELLAAAKPIKISTSKNTVTDDGTIETTVDTFWLPSGTEYYGNVNNGEGTYFPYWKSATGFASPSNGANVGRIHYALENHNSAQTVRLRSAHRSNAYNACCVHASGGVSSSVAYNAYRCCPTCAIYNNN